MILGRAASPALRRKLGSRLGMVPVDELTGVGIEPTPQAKRLVDWWDHFGEETVRWFVRCFSFESDIVALGSVRWVDPAFPSQNLGDRGCCGHLRMAFTQQQGLDLAPAHVGNRSGVEYTTSTIASGVSHPGRVFRVLGRSANPSSPSARCRYHHLAAGLCETPKRRVARELRRIIRTCRARYRPPGSPRARDRRGRVLVPTCQ